jgi:hypothetical protein
MRNMRKQGGDDDFDGNLGSHGIAERGRTTKFMNP